MSWNEPRNPGPPITGYDIRFRKGTSGSYTTIEDITGTKTTIAHVDDGGSITDDAPAHAEHLLRGAREGEDPERDSAWSALTTGRTSAGNQDAIFDDRPDNEAAKTGRTIERTVNENTRAGQNVGLTIWTRDRDSLDLQAGRGRRSTMSDFGKVRHQQVDGTDPDQGSTESRGRTVLTATSANDEPGNTTCTYTVNVEVRDGKDEHGNTGSGRRRS